MTTTPIAGTKVTMSTAMTGDNFHYAAGDCVLIEDAETAKRWCDKGAATLAEDDAKVKHRYRPAEAGGSPAENRVAAQTAAQTAAQNGSKNGSSKSSKDGK